MRSGLVACCVLAMSFLLGEAQASSIGVFFAPDGSDCDIFVGPFTPFSTYVIAFLGGDAAQTGLTGAEFRLDGVDPAWFNTVTPNPSSNLMLGSPITGGCNIAFPTCMSGSNVLLCTIQSLALAPIAPRNFSIERHTTPSNPNFQCPLVTLCDAPAFTKLCVGAGIAYVNHVCGMGVEAKSWTAVKRLFD